MDDNKMIDDLVKMLDSGMMQGVGHVNVDTDSSMFSARCERLAFLTSVRCVACSLTISYVGCNGKDGSGRNTIPIDYQ